ncbi:hypothetical protein PCH_Pc22g22520 [Penicillium rubens Wisconsin 54-1255]|uniref:Uncharacterized protein n=1 Tax=Penicillium rubens (strain ATCC 28089 / DSM 1075 / NRRL 1951 / Wisconsin 54-1255) TaxID=500485 RepID=B6HU89_PENRW|nr:hypothetical protein PCH_Pc22g22520 [Penicillium rubens Wisconsin 54-1255]
MEQAKVILQVKMLETEITGNESGSQLELIRGPIRFKVPWFPRGDDSSGLSGADDLPQIICPSYNPTVYQQITTTVALEGVLYGHALARWCYAAAGKSDIFGRWAAGSGTLYSLKAHGRLTP